MEGQKVDPLSGKLYSEVDLQPRKLLSKGDQEEEEKEEGVEGARWKRD